LSSQQVCDLRAKARRARDFASRVGTDQQTIDNLKSYADDLDREADKLERELKVAQIAEKPLGQEPSTGAEAAAALISPTPDDTEKPT